MRTASNTTTFLGRTALATLVFTAVGFGAATAGAETPVQGPGLVIVQPEVDPEPQPQPQPIGEIADTPVDPGPDPMPKDELDIAQPQPQPEPHPAPDQGPDDKAPVPADPEPQPNPGHDGPGEITDGGCNATHGCEPECDEKLGSCDLTDGDPGEGDVPDDEPGDENEDDTPQDAETPTDGSADVDETEVHDDSTVAGQLPHTGGGIALLAGLGTALTGLGVGIRRWASR